MFSINILHLFRPLNARQLTKTTSTENLPQQKHSKKYIFKIHNTDTHKLRPRMFTYVIIVYAVSTDKFFKPSTSPRSLLIPTSWSSLKTDCDIKMVKKDYFMYYCKNKLTYYENILEIYTTGRKLGIWLTLTIKINKSFQALCIRIKNSDVCVSRKIHKQLTEYSNSKSLCCIQFKATGHLEVINQRGRSLSVTAICSVCILVNQNRLKNRMQHIL